MGNKNLAVATAAVALALAAFVEIIPASLHAQQPRSSANHSTNDHSTIGRPIADRLTTDRSTTDSSEGAAETPYDWKASFAKIPAGKVPRTPNGKPDLQGLWSYLIPTPLEQPGGPGEEEIVTTESEDAELDAQLAQIRLRSGSAAATSPVENKTDNYRTLWREGYWSKMPVIALHASQVVDPADGRVPPLTPAAQERLRRAAATRSRPATGPEDRPITTRCVRGLWSGPPIIGQGAGSYLDNLQIVQNSKVVVVRQEVMHESQIIPLDGRPRPPENIHLDKGVARGHWEGDTLVVKSTNFKDWGIGVFSNHGTTEKMRLTERWKRLDENHLLYGFTIDDPGTWTKPWSVEFILWRMANQEQLLEYACHEGNVGMSFALSGARAKERQQAEGDSEPR